ncbi:hypothetical protein F5884DRAFT_58632 [Xylogone sp. PMI_703]|nr:hypothetical protein F5884DRAFT_58632 [Xylogone sp. PMI_703]
MTLRLLPCCVSVAAALCFAVTVELRCLAPYPHCPFERFLSNTRTNIYMSPTGDRALAQWVLDTHALSFLVP